MEEHLKNLKSLIKKSKNRLETALRKHKLGKTFKRGFVVKEAVLGKTGSKFSLSYSPPTFKILNSSPSRTVVHLSCKHYHCHAILYFHTSLFKYRCSPRSCTIPTNNSTTSRKPLHIIPHVSPSFDHTHIYQLSAFSHISATSRPFHQDTRSSNDPLRLFMVRGREHMDASSDEKSLEPTRSDTDSQNADWFSPDEYPRLWHLCRASPSWVCCNRCKGSTSSSSLSSRYSSLSHIRRKILPIPTVGV